MNHKLEPACRTEGYCCLYAFFKAHEKKLTGELLKMLGKPCTIRALQQQRARYNDEEYSCEKLEACLKRAQKLSSISS